MEPSDEAASISACKSEFDANINAKTFSKKGKKRSHSPERHDVEPTSVASFKSKPRFDKQPKISAPIEIELVELQHADVQPEENAEVQHIDLQPEEDTLEATPEIQTTEPQPNDPLDFIPAAVNQKKKKTTSKSWKTRVEDPLSDLNKEDDLIISNKEPRRSVMAKCDKYFAYNVDVDIRELVVDEIALEGLDGITIEALWTRLSVATCNSLPIENLKGFIWTMICSMNDMEFYELPEARSKLVIFNRHEHIDPEFEIVLDPVTAPEDIYPYSCVFDKTSKIVGSCATYHERENITDDVKQLSLAEAEAIFGLKLVMVASQKLRQAALFGLFSSPELELTEVQYCMLERIGRSRYLGEITQGKVSLQVVTSDAKMAFYHRKALLKANLIRKQMFNLKANDTYNISGTLFHLTRFYNEHKSNAQLLTERIVTVLKQKPHNRLQYPQLREEFPDIKYTVMKRLLKSADFQRFVHTDVMYPYRKMYPQALEHDWKCKQANREKHIRVIELINPKVNVNISWRDEDQNEYSSDEEFVQGIVYNKSVYRQLYNMLLKSGPNGLTLKEVMVQCGLDFYTVRSSLLSMEKRNAIGTIRVDVGRQRTFKYYARCFNDSSYLKQFQDNQDKLPLPAQSYDCQIADESLDFVAKILGVSPGLIDPKQKNVNAAPITKPFDNSKGKYSLLHKLKHEAKLNKYKQKDQPQVQVLFDPFGEEKRLYTKTQKRKSVIPIEAKIYANEHDFVELKNTIRVDNVTENVCPTEKSVQICKALCETLVLSEPVAMSVKDFTAACTQEIEIAEIAPQLIPIANPAVPTGESSKPSNAKRKLPRPQQRRQIPVKRTVVYNKTSHNLNNFMGEDPILILDQVIGEGLHTAITISAAPQYYANPDMKYFNYENLSVRTLKRANFIIDTVRQEKVISNLPKLNNMIYQIEKQEGYSLKIDRKSVNRIYGMLVKDGFVRVAKVMVEFLQIRHTRFIVFCPTVDIANHTEMALVLEQLKMKFMAPTRKKVLPSSWKQCISISAPVETPDAFTIPETTLEITSSASELKELSQVPNDIKMKYNRCLGKFYGFSPKFRRMALIHEFLYYLIYDYPDNVVSGEVPSIVNDLLFKGERDLLKELPPIYNPNGNWKMFVPPLPVHSGWPSGWAIMCDILLRMPLSLFVRLYNVSVAVPHLSSFLKHPIKQHLLIKQLPAQMRMPLLFQRKYITSIYETLCNLCYIGVLQFGPQKLKEKEQGFIFLNRNATLYDTTTSKPGYHIVEKKEYRKLTFYFSTPEIVDQYWSQMCNICLQTKLGRRETVTGTYITLQNIGSKPKTRAALAPKTPFTAPLADTGFLPGDGYGAAGLDSALWPHIKRNWIWSTYVTMCHNAQGNWHCIKKDVKQIVQAKKVKLIRKKTSKVVALPDGNSSDSSTCSTARIYRKRRTFKSLATRGYGGIPFIREIRPVKPRQYKHKKRDYYDMLDRKIMRNLARRRVHWNKEEDEILLICKTATIYLFGNVHKKYVYFNVMRDILHILSPISVNKTSRACQRRIAYIIRMQKPTKLILDRVKLLNESKYFTKYFKGLRTRILSVPTCNQMETNVVFAYIVWYLYTNRGDFINFPKQPKSRRMKIVNYLGDKYDFLSHKNTETVGFYTDVQSKKEVLIDTAKSLIHSSLSCEQHKVGLAYQLFRVYQTFADEILRRATAELHETRILTVRKIAKNKIESLENFPVRHSQFRLSYHYMYLQLTYFPIKIYSQSHDLLSGVRQYQDIMSNPTHKGLLMDCLRQGHILGLAEMSLHTHIRCNLVNIPNNVVILNPYSKNPSEVVQQLVIEYAKLLGKDTFELANDLCEVPSDPESEEENVEILGGTCNESLAILNEPQDIVEAGEEEINSGDLEKEISETVLIFPRTEIQEGFVLPQDKLLQTLNEKLIPGNRDSSTLAEDSDMEVEEPVQPEEIHAVASETPAEDLEEHKDNAFIGKGFAVPGLVRAQPEAKQNISEDLETSRNDVIQLGVEEACFTAPRDFEKQLKDGRLVVEKTQKCTSNSIVDDFLNPRPSTSKDSGKQMLPCSKNVTKYSSIFLKSGPLLQATERPPLESPVEGEPTEEDGMASDVYALTYTELIKEITGIMPLDKRKISPHRLAQLLAQGTFPEVEDELSKHFMINLPEMYFSMHKSDDDSKYFDYIFEDHALICKKVIEKIQGDAIFSVELPSTEVVHKEFLAQGCDSSDLDFVECLILFVKTMGVVGVRATEIKDEFASVSVTLDLVMILQLLSKLHVLLRAGTANIVYVHHCYAESWLIDTYALKDDDKKLESSRTPANTLKSYREIKARIMPWVLVNGAVNFDVLEQWLATVLSHCLTFPFIPLTKIFQKFCYLKPVDLFCLVEYLQELGCVRLVAFEKQISTLLSTPGMQTKAPAKLTDDFAKVSVEIDNMAVIKFGAFVNRCKMAVELPFQDQWLRQSSKNV